MTKFEYYMVVDKTAPTVVTMDDYKSVYNYVGGFRLMSSKSLEDAQEQFNRTSLGDSETFIVTVSDSADGSELISFDVTANSVMASIVAGLEEFNSKQFHKETDFHPVGGFKVDSKIKG